MLKITSHKIAQVENFTAVKPGQLQPNQQWCVVCHTPIVDVGYIDHQGFAGMGTGAVLCPDHAAAASQSATTAMPMEPEPMPEETEMVEPFPR